MPDTDPYFTPDPPPAPRRGGKPNYDEIIDRHSARTGLDANLVRAVVGHESGNNPTAVSPKGARGLGQLMPATARRFGVRDVNDPEQNIRGATDYLKFLTDRYKGDTDKVLAGYNAGEGNVDKYGGIPPFKETRNYVPAVKARYQKLTGQPPPRQGQQDKYLTPDTPKVDPYFTPAEDAQPAGRGAAMARVAQSSPVTSLRGASVRPMRRREGWGGGGTVGSGVADTTRPPIGPTTSGMGDVHIAEQREALRAQLVQKYKTQLQQADAPMELGFVSGPDPRTNDKYAEEAARRADEEMAAQRRLQSADVVKGRKEMGVMPAWERAYGAPALRVAGGLLKSAAGSNPALMGLEKITGRSLTDYLQKKGQQLEDVSTTPLNAQGEAIARGVPEKVGTAITDLGFSLVQIAAIQKATGLPMSQIMAMESALKSSDKPAKDRAVDIAQAYGMGKILDQHLSRPASAALFGAPTAIQTGAAVARGDMTLGDALLETGIQTASGAVLGGKPKESPNLGSSKPGRLSTLIAPENPITPAPAEGVESAIEFGANRIVGPSKPVEIAPDEGAKLNRWQHRDFGAVTESANQSGAPQGRVRVIDENGIEHVIQRPKGTGAGNQIAVPLKPKTEVAQSADEIAQAQEDAPFKVIDRRRRPGETNVDISSRTSDLPVTQPDLPQAIARPLVEQASQPEPEVSIPAQPATSVSPEGAATVAPTPEIVKPWEMTRSQIEEEYQRKKAEDDNLEASILGPELAKKYDRLQRAANSSYDTEKANRASDEIEKIEAALSERDRNRLYGIGEEGPQVDELKDYRQSLGNLDDHDPQSLAESMRWAVSRVGNETDPSKMNHDQRVAYGTLREAARIAYERGWDTQAISREAVKAAAGRFADPEDAAFMLDRFIKKEPQTSTPQRKQIAQVASPLVSEGGKEPPIGEELQRQLNDRTITVNHGTAAPDFEDFKVTRKAGTSAEETDQPIFFSLDPALANAHAGGAKGGRVIPAYLKIKKLFDYRDPAIQEMLSRDIEGNTLFKDRDDYDERRNDLKWGRWDLMESPEIQNYIKSKGYDGFTLNGEGGLSIGVFDPKQIKMKYARGEAKVEPKPTSQTVQPDPYFTLERSGDEAQLPQSANRETGVGVPEREPSITSAKKEQLAADRAELDLPELPQAERKGWQLSLDNAKEKGLDKRADLLASEVLSKPRALNDEETAGLVLRAQELKNDHARVMKEIGDATDSEQIKAKVAERAAIESAFDTVTKAAKASGTEKGRSLASQKLTINQDYDLVSVVQRMKAAKGRELTADERAKYEGMVKERDQAILDRDAALERAHTAELQRQINKSSRQRKRSETKDVLDTEAETIKQNIVAEIARLKAQSAKGQFTSMAGLGSLDPDGVIAKNLIKYARNRVRANVGLKAEALIDEVHDLIKDSGATRRQVAEVLSGYMKPRDTKAIDAATKQLADIRKEIKTLLGKEDIQSGVRTASQQGPKPDYIRRNRELKIVHGRIAELKKMVDTGVRTVRGKAEHVPDVELEKLRTERATLTDAVRALGDPNATQKAIDAALRSVTKSVEAMESKVKSGDVAPVRQTVSPWSKELGEQQQRRADLQKQIAEMRKANRPATNIAQRRIEQTLAATNKSIETLEKRIAQGQTRVPVREGAQSAYSPEIAVAKKVQAELQKTLDDMRTAERKAAPPLPLKQGPSKRFVSRNTTRLKQLQAKEADLTARMAAGDYNLRAKPEPLPYTREVYAAQKRAENIERQFQNEAYKANRGTKGRIYDEVAKFGNLPKTLKSMADISAVFRQGGFYAFTHPVEGLVKPSRDMFRSFSEMGYRNVENAIKGHPKFDLAKRSGVEFTGVDKNDPNLSHKEEGYLGTDALGTISRGKLNPLRIVKGTADFSERTFVGFLDSQRMHVFNQMAKGLESQGITYRNNPEAYKAAARLINQGTGRGNLGIRGNQAAPLLNLAMFSPRLVASRVQLLNNMFNPVKIASMPRGTRAMMIKDNVKFLAGTAAVVALAKAAGGTVNTDPDDGDFLKIRFGDTTYDTLTGLQQPLRYILNMGAAVKADITKDETYSGKSKADLTTRFARSKLAPLASVATDYVSGQDFSGRQFSPKREAMDLITPLPASDFVEAMRKEGLLKGALKASPTLTGIGVQTYDQVPEKATTTKAEKLARKFARDSMPDEARTDEEIDKGKRLSELRARSRQGQDVSVDLKNAGATDKQTKSILSARQVTRLQEDFKKLPLKQALTVYGTASPTEQAKLKEIMSTKAIGVDVLPLEDQASVRAKLKELGFTPGAQIPKRPERPEGPKRPNPRAWGYAP